MPGAADEGALELAQQLLGGFGAVLVQRVGPAAGDPGQEVGVVLGGRAGQGVFHPGRGLRVADVPDPVQCERDDRRGPGGDLAGGDGGAEFLVHGGHGPAGESLPGQQRSARVSRRRASAAPIRSRARRNSAVFRYPSSAAADVKPAAVTAGARPASRVPPTGRREHRVLGFHPVSQPPAGPGPPCPEPHPADIFSPAARLPACVRSTAAAAMIWQILNRAGTDPRPRRRTPKPLEKVQTCNVLGGRPHWMCAAAPALRPALMFTASPLIRVPGTAPNCRSRPGIGGPWPSVGLIRDELSYGFHD